MTRSRWLMVFGWAVASALLAFIPPNPASLFELWAAYFDLFFMPPVLLALVVGEMKHVLAR